ncbi:MAG: hypothetical protein V4549_05735 [Bacteroidota bacterium]
MGSINERLAIKDDEGIKILFPTIENNQMQLLLIYEASESLHNKDLKDEIVKFLIKKGAKDIAVYVNSSIYFKLPGTYSKVALRILNDEFEIHIAKFESKHKGKIFWIFNYILKYGKVNQTFGIAGRGNKTFYDNFIENLEKFVLSLRIRAKFRTKLRHLKDI